MNWSDIYKCVRARVRNSWRDANQLHCCIHCVRNIFVNKSISSQLCLIRVDTLCQTKAFRWVRVENGAGFFFSSLLLCTIQIRFSCSGMIWNVFCANLAGYFIVICNKVYESLLYIFILYSADTKTWKIALLINRFIFCSLFTYI